MTKKKVKKKDDSLIHFTKEIKEVMGPIQRQHVNDFEKQVEEMTKFLCDLPWKQTMLIFAAIQEMMEKHFARRGTTGLV